MASIFPNLWAAIYARAIADSGSNGLFDSLGTAYLIGGFWNNQGPRNNPMPFCVYNVGADANRNSRGKRLVEVTWRLSTFVAIKDSSIAVAMTRGAAILARTIGDWNTATGYVPTYGFDHWAPTVTGFASSPMNLLSTRELHENTVLHWVQEFSLFIST